MRTLCSDCANCFFFNDLMHCAGDLELLELLESVLVHGEDCPEFQQWLTDHAVHFEQDNCPMFVPTDTFDSEIDEEDDNEGDDGY